MKSNFLTILTLALVLSACGGSAEQHDAPHATESVAVPASEMMTTVIDSLTSTTDSLLAVPDSMATVVDSAAAAVSAEVEGE
ncbi:MAG: hypothetical protein SH809_04425 [Rhodothermales bacterium]|nr:hypothetical protein [Rhodothermales bacterium]